MPVLLICAIKLIKPFLLDTLSANNQVFERENVVNVVLASYHSVQNPLASRLFTASKNSLNGSNMLNPSSDNMIKKIYQLCCHSHIFY